MTKERVKSIALIVSLILIIVLALFANRYYGKYQESTQLNDAANAELIVYKDKDGYNRAKIETLQTANYKTFLAFQTQDSAIKELQRVVKENSKYLRERGSVTNFNTNTSINTSSPTEVTFNPIDSLPEYRSKFDLQGWAFGSTVATKDSTYVKLNVKNKYSLVIGKEPTGLFGLGKGKPFADVKNYNPYSTTESLRTYEV